MKYNLIQTMLGKTIPGNDRCGLLHLPQFWRYLLCGDFNTNYGGLLCAVFLHLQLRRHPLCGGLIISFTEVFLISNCGGISFAEVVLTPIAGASPLRRFLSSPIAGVSPLRSFFSSPIAGASPLQSFNHLLYGGISHHQLQSILICRNYSNLQLRRFSHLLCGGFRYLSHQKLCNYKELSMYTFFLYAFISVC